MHWAEDSTFHYDATNPRARQYVWDKVQAELLPTTASVLFWLDEAEPEYGVYDFDLYRYEAGVGSRRSATSIPQAYARGLL